MRFRSKSQPRGILSGKEQRRLTLLVLGIGIVLIGFNTIGRTGFWAGIFPNQPAVDSAANRDSVPGLGPDEFVAGGSVSSSRQAADPDKWLDAAAARRFESSQAQSDSQSRIPLELRGSIRDDVIGVHSTESDAYYVALRVAEKLPRSESKEATPASYALFMDAPEMCRGRIWRITGEIRRIENVQSAANAFGVNSLYDVWLSTPDSGNQLVHLIASSVDQRIAAALSRGQQSIPVEAAGVYFKREGYRRAGDDGSGDIGLTPLLLCGRVRYLTPQVAVATRAEELTPWLGWFAATLGAGVLLILWRFSASDRIFRTTRTHQLTALPVRPGFAGVEAQSVSDSLRKMEQEHTED